MKEGSSLRAAGPLAFYLSHRRGYVGGVAFLLSRLGAGAFIAAAFVHCSSFGDSGDVIPETSDARDDASSGGGDATTPIDANPADTGGDAHAVCASGCPGSAGPCGVKVGDFCIDATEVTVADYRAFSKAANGTTIDVGAPCAPVLVTPLGVRSDETLPMTNVDFCESRAFCKWAGKRLCGHTSGRSLLPNETRTQVSIWYNACTGGTADAIHLLSDGGCQLEATAPRAAGSGCQGGVPGAFDMVGNVWEWVDQPNEQDGAKATAVFAGGGYEHPSTTNCNDLSGANIDFRGNDVGFRCCSP